ncbi:MAG TPA: hypothetical protein EYP85_00560 [Armatimonadetes bacterium]|nr:hypothetical protein [Armatimonadota bacterium]
MEGGWEEIEYLRWAEGLVAEIYAPETDGAHLEVLFYEGETRPVPPAWEPFHELLLEAIVARRLLLEPVTRPPERQQELREHSQLLKRVLKKQLARFLPPQGGKQNEAHIP